MSRMLAVLLALTGLTFISSSPANAGTRPQVYVGIHVSATTVSEEDLVVVSGKAYRADRRTHVTLQLRTPSAWENVASQHISDTRHYAFSVAPPRGAQRYRVVTVRRPHQKIARSSVVHVAVTWQPVLGLTGTPAVHGDGTQWVELSGSVMDAPAAPVVDLLSRTPSTAWTTAATFTPSDGTFGTEVPRSPHRLYRAVLRATDLTPEVESAAVDSQASPYVLDLGRETEVDLSPDSTTATVLLRDVTQGQDVTLVINDRGRDDPWQASVTAPDLSQVGHVGSICSCGSQHLIRFTAPETGSYQIHLVGDQDFLSLDLAASAAIELDLVQDGLAASYSASVPGQEFVATFHANVGDALVIEGPGSGAQDPTTEVLSEPDGSSLKPMVRRDPSRGYAPVFLADQTGTFTYRFSPSPTAGTGTIRIRRATQTTVTVDGDPVSVQVDNPGGVSLIWADLATGDVISVRADQTVPVQTLMDTDAGYLPDAVGTGGKRLVVVRCCTSNDTGPVVVRAGSPLELTAGVDGEAPAYDLTGWNVRAVDVSFMGEAGQAVEPASSADLFLDRATLVDPDGHVVTELVRNAWVLPKDGAYVLRIYMETFGPGTLGVRSIPIVDVPTDGTAATLNLVHGDGLVLGRLMAAAGSSVDATLSDVDESLGISWVVSIMDSQDRGIDFWTEGLLVGNRPPDTRPTFSVPSDGIVYFALYSTNNTTGSVRLSAVVHQG